jgi:hypothetical protein
MATWETGKSTFTCRKRGAKYEATYRDYPARDEGEFKCLDCGETVHSWRGTRDYQEWKLITHGTTRATGVED